MAPGTTQVNILVGSNATVLASGGIVSVVSNATRAYKSGVVVTALSQPVIPAGATAAAAGNLQISETLAGQFKVGEDVCVVVLPRASNGFTHQDTMLTMAQTSQLPVITTNYAASGLLASTVGNPGGCTNQGEISYFLGLGVTLSQSNSFEFSVTQQAFNTLGVITISNITYTTTADAPFRPGARQRLQREPDQRGSRCGRVPGQRLERQDRRRAEAQHRRLQRPWPQADDRLHHQDPEDPRPSAST